MNDSFDAGNDLVEGTFEQLKIDDEWSMSLERGFTWTSSTPACLVDPWV